MEGIVLAGRADVMLGYCSDSAPVMHAVPALTGVPLPEPLLVGRLIVLSDNPFSARFAMVVQSEPGQTILRENGFDPIDLP